jgi:hypothetical protein
MHQLGLIKSARKLGSSFFVSDQFRGEDPGAFVTPPALGGQNHASNISISSQACVSGQAQQI